jgi:hypothetical protein
MEAEPASQAGGQRAHLGSLGARKHHAERVQQHQLRVVLDAFRHVLPLRQRNELRQPLDLARHGR